MKNVILSFLIISLLMGCSSAKRSFNKRAQKVFESAFYENQFTGILVVNQQNKDTLFNFNDKKYFTPASTTKIVTLFTALEFLPDSIPALKYRVRNDTLYVEGTGDPTFLHPYFESSKTLDFLQNYDHISVHLNNFEDEKYGPGWAWEDYQYYFQPEKGPLPLYGNVVTLQGSPGTLAVTPSYFKDSVMRQHSQRNRDWQKNTFYYARGRKDTVEIPYSTRTSLTEILLEKALGKRVGLASAMPKGEKRTLYSVHTDTVYKRMMIESDNFLAEQLLLLSSAMRSDTLNSAKVREHMLTHALADLKQQPRWVDGSGLSRYNLFTPESIVQVLSKLYDKLPRKRLFALFPTGGEGTLKDWYPGDPEPYLYAKTGSVGNNHNICGYLRTKSGKTLIFSFMNNHFRQPSSEVKKKMQRFFEALRDAY